MNGCAMPAPAPWASTRAARASGGACSSAETRVVASTAIVSASAAVAGMRTLCARGRTLSSGLLRRCRSRRGCRAADVGDDDVADRARPRFGPRQQALLVLVARDQLDAAVVGVAVALEHGVAAVRAVRELHLALEPVG